MERICLEEAKRNPKLLRQLEKSGRPMRVHARAMSDEELVEKLAACGVAIDRRRFGVVDWAIPGGRSHRPGTLCRIAPIQTGIAAFQENRREEGLGIRLDLGRDQPALGTLVSGPGEF